MSKVLRVPLTCMMLCMPLLGCAKEGPPEVWLVTDSKPTGVIVIPAHLPPKPVTLKKPLWIEFGVMQSHARSSAEILAEYIRKSTGAELPIVTEDAVPDGASAIHVGATALAKGRAKEVSLLDDDGFLIAVPDASTVLLTGASKQGTEFAVYDFLERELGVRWLFPGELGEHVPVQKDLHVAGPDRTSEPAYLSRLFRGRGKSGIEWTRRNRMHSRIEFHHNISKLTPISWTKTHPEFFPLIDGQRRLPKGQNQQDWHFCYSAEGLEEEMANLVLNNFEKHPEYPSVSLAVSDAVDRDYCQCESCLSQRGEGVNSLGYPHYSDMHFTWANEVVERVLAERPNTTWFGSLAYREVADPPSFPLHDRLVPYLAWELLQWAVPERRSAWKKQVTDWSKSAQHFGHYEYMFGEKYMLVPRLYLHALADYCKYAHQEGAIAFYAEITGTQEETSWYAGPQLYGLLRLLWDPTLDVDDLLHDWCTAAVGPEAAPHLEAYFKDWERFWTERVPETTWFESHSKTYLKFNSTDYLAALDPEDLDRAEEQLLRVVEAAPKGPARQRADMFLAEFQKRRSEVLDTQVGIWALQKKIPEFSVGDPVFREDFRSETKSWVPISSNDSDLVGRDLNKGHLHFTGNSTIAVPAIKVKAGQAYVVSWRVKAEDLPENVTVTFDMKGISDEKGETSIQRHLRGGQLPLDYQTLQYAFIADAGEGDEVELRCSLWVRGARSGNLWLEDFSVAPLSTPIAGKHDLL